MIELILGDYFYYFGLGLQSVGRLAQTCRAAADKLQFTTRQEGRTTTMSVYGYDIAAFMSKFHCSVGWLNDFTATIMCWSAVNHRSTTLQMYDDVGAAGSAGIAAIRAGDSWFKYNGQLAGILKVCRVVHDVVTVRSIQSAPSANPLARRIVLRAYFDTPTLRLCTRTHYPVIKCTKNGIRCGRISLKYSAGGKYRYAFGNQLLYSESSPEEISRNNLHLADMLLEIL